MRIAVVLATGFSTSRFADAGAYQFAARTLSQTLTYPKRTEEFLFRPPGYPVLLALTTLGRPDRVAAARLANAAVGALCPVLLAALSARLFRRRGLALATGLLAALHPTLALVASDIQSEPLFIALLLSAGYLLLAATDRPSSNLAVLAGVCLALAALTRSSALALVPFLLAPLCDARHPRRANAHIALSALLGFAAALAPWTLRNAVVFRELIVVNDGAGYVFYGRNCDAALGLGQARDRAELARAVLAIDAARRERIAALPPAGQDSPGRLSRALTAAALSERRANPRGTARLLAWKTWDWLRPYPDPRFWPRWAVFAAGAWFSALFLCAAIGFARAERTGASAFCLAFLAATMLVHVALETNWRYRTANWDPIVLLYAASGAASLLGPRRRAPRTPS